MAIAPLKRALAVHEERGVVEVELWDEATRTYGRPTYTIVDDPEAGTFEIEDFQWMFAND